MTHSTRRGMANTDLSQILITFKVKDGRGRENETN